MRRLSLCMCLLRLSHDVRARRWFISSVRRQRVSVSTDAFIRAKGV